MIERLRSLHFRALCVLAVGLPVLLAAALVARRPTTPPNPALRWDAATPESAKWRGTVSFRVGENSATICRSADGQWLRITPSGELMQPDLLVYHSKTAPQPGPPPADAHLLGAFDGRRPATFSLPTQAAETRGYMLIFSLPHQETLGSVAIGSLP